jgi:hypothetical protein
MNGRVLLAADASEASVRAATYVGCLMAEHPAARIGVLTIVPEIQPLHLETSEFLATNHAGLLLPTELEAPPAERAAPILRKIHQVLVEAGFPESRIEASVGTTTVGEPVVAALIASARRGNYRTIAVGRNALPWHREIFRRHLADALIRKVRGLTVWVVE